MESFYRSIRSICIEYSSGMWLTIKTFYHLIISLSLICSKIYPLFLPALPKNLPIILFLFSYHYLFFSFCSFGLYFQVLINSSREKHGLETYCCSYCLNFSDAKCIRTNKIVNENNLCLSLNCACFITYVTVCTEINITYLHVNIL